MLFVIVNQGYVMKILELPLMEEEILYIHTAKSFQMKIFICKKYENCGWLKNKSRHLKEC